MSNQQIGQQQRTAYQEAEAVVAKGIAESMARVQQAVEHAQRAAIQKREKEKKAELEAEDDSGGIRISLGPHNFGQEQGQSGAAPMSLEEQEKEAQEDILKQIEAHKKEVGEHHRDFDKPVVGADKENGQVYGGRIIAVNGHFVALAVGKEIEIHKLADLAPNMMYDGKGPWTDKDQILHLGNTMDVRYKDGQAAVANVHEMAQERQQERKGLSR